MRSQIQISRFIFHSARNVCMAGIHGDALCQVRWPQRTCSTLPTGLCCWRYYQRPPVWPARAATDASLPARQHPGETRAFIARNGTFPFRPNEFSGVSSDLPGFCLGRLPFYLLHATFDYKNSICWRGGDRTQAC